MNALGATRFSNLLLCAFLIGSTGPAIANNDSIFFDPSNPPPSGSRFQLSGNTDELLTQELLQNHSTGSNLAPSRVRQRPPSRPSNSSELANTARARQTEPEYRNRDDINEMIKYIPMYAENETGERINLRNQVSSAGIPRVPLARAIDFRQRMIDEGQEINSRYLVVSDLTRDARKDRMWLIDLKTGEVVGYKTAHGAAGGNQANCANRFGNRANSNASPGGGYVFGCQFEGSQIRGTRNRRRSMVMKGMDEENANSWNREVIFHEGIALRGNVYTTSSRGGRSSGCLTIEIPLYEEFVEKVNQGDRCENLADMTPQGGAPVYVYPERSDVRAREPVYWDAQCKASLRNTARVYLDD